jgi:3'-phosphoadenosine 5'-phosphosulfate sulfotransferase (PAPS reductase)/FAD synthetase
MRLDVPELVRGIAVVASVSGGKDSTALMLALREAEVPFRAVFSDTGWEARETYEYLDLLREKIGSIDVVRPKRDMIESIRHRAGFPARMQRWCTQELKLTPLRAYHDALGVETVNAMGVRGEESARRAAMPEWADDEEWGGYVWRPLIAWKVEDVIAIHHRHGVPLNPLYRAGFDRVGCWPCIFSRKDEIRGLADKDPERVALIAALEAEATQLRADRNAETPGRYAHEQAVFFQTRTPGQVMPIRDIVAWSRTSTGGRQLPLLVDPPQGGCMRWGMCEAPT